MKFEKFSEADRKLPMDVMSTKFREKKSYEILQCMKREGYNKLNQIEKLFKRLWNIKSYIGFDD